MQTDERSGEARNALSAPATGLVVQANQITSATLWRRFVLRLVVLGLFWAFLTEFRLDGLIFGLPAVIAAAALVFVLPSAPGWRLSAKGSLAFALWFAMHSVLGAVDVARRAFSPSLPLRPGFRPYQLSLPAGAPRIVFLNAITLLPGTLSAEIVGNKVVVHMLDTRADLESDLQMLEMRVAALFALSHQTKASS